MMDGIFLLRNFYKNFFTFGEKKALALGFLPLKDQYRILFIALLRKGGWMLRKL